jgi:putative Ca2+/H+ antiporter (TMEM165/GDT1 family)
MDALLPTFLATFLAEWGDRTQLLAVMLAVRFKGNPRVLMGIAAAAIANGVLSAYFGTLIAHYVNFRALTLLTAFALAFAGGAMVLPQKSPTLSSYGTESALVTSFLGFGILAFGDKTQFVTMAMAARTDSLLLVGLGAAGGVILANAPAVLLGEKMAEVIPMRIVRIGAGVLLMIAASISAISALRLI